MTYASDTRITQFRLLETVAAGHYWMPGELSLPTLRRSRLNLLEDATVGQPKEEKKPSWARRAWDAGAYVSRLVTPQGQLDMAKENLGRALGWTDKTSWLDKAQDVVSLVGIADPSGIADTANALVYGARGKWGDAAISLAGAAVPYAGDILKVFKFARGTAKAAAAGKAVARTAAVEKTAAKVDARVVNQARREARQGSWFERQKQVAQVKARRKAGRQLRSAEKIATGKGKVRGAIGKAYDTYKGYKKEFDRRFHDRKEEPGTDDKEKPEPQEVPPSPGDDPLTRRTVDDPKPAQPAPEKPAETPPETKPEVAKSVDEIKPDEKKPEASKPDDETKPDEKREEPPPQKPHDEPVLARKTIDDKKPQDQPDVPPEDEGKPTGPPDKETVDKAAAPEKTEPSKPAPAENIKKAGSGIGSGKTPKAGRPMVPESDKCPPPDTKTSKWGTKAGFKRCHPQTRPRAH